MGKITIVRRTVERHTVGSTDDDPVVTTQDDGDMCVLLGDTATFEVFVEIPRQPFQGYLEFVLSRRTDTPGVFGRVAVYQAALPIPSKTAGARFTWDGRAMVDVPRQYSDRQLFDHNQQRMVNIPLREVAAGAHVHHGVYVVERITLFEKDGSVAADLRPDLELQDRTAVVVLPLIEIVFAPPQGGDRWRPLMDVGFGDASGVPFVAFCENAIHRAVEAYLPVRSVMKTIPGPDGPIHRWEEYQRVRIVRSYGFHRTEGFLVLVDLSKAGGPSFTTAPGATEANLAEYGSDPPHNNLFCWVDDLRSPMIRTIVCWCVPFLENQPSKPTETRLAFAKAFGPIGFPEDSCWLIEDGETVALPGPNGPRVASGGSVVGAVTAVDMMNVVVALDRADANMITVTSTDASIVPEERAADIQRALRAVVGYLSQIIAHELGHFFGICGPMSEAFGGPQSTGGLAMPDGSTATSVMSQDPAGHDVAYTETGLMVSGERQPLAQSFRLSGPIRSFTTDQLAYLTELLPLSIEIADE